MKKMFNYIKTKFFTKNFITFCIIGVLNTAINFLVMKFILYLFDMSVEYDISTSDAGFMYYMSMALSTLIAFVVASIFSFFANAKFTYKEKSDNRTFFEAMLAFVSRFAITYLFTLLIWWLLLLVFKVENDPDGWYRTISNLIASVIMIPPFYLALGLVFKRAKNRREKAENLDTDQQ